MNYHNLKFKGMGYLISSVLARLCILHQRINTHNLFFHNNHFYQIWQIYRGVVLVVIIDVTYLMKYSHSSMGQQS